MKLNLQGIQSDWPEGYKLPAFDIEAMKKRTAEAPTWLQLGAGNIFRIFVAVAQQDLLEAGLSDTGIVVYEGFDEEIIPKAFTPHDNLTLGVTLNANGSTQKRVIASIADAFFHNTEKLHRIMVQPSLQIISIIITEKGYTVDKSAVCAGPGEAKTTLEQLVSGLHARFNENAPPLALVTMDNFAENGEKLAHAVLAVAEVWEQRGFVPAGFVPYLKTYSYPWTMIDKITPRPSADVAKILQDEGYQDIEVSKTAKNTFVASFVNAESAQYLVIEDDFPNGRPPLEKAGIYFADKETVRKIDQMKVCACLNPLHTILAISGMLLNIPTISECMKNDALVRLIKASAEEALPVVADPGIINPRTFLEEVITERFPNPFIPDEPARIACDTSQKVPVRFGEMLKARKAQGMDIENLKAAPLFIALWLRYRMAVRDTGEAMELSPDPRLPEKMNVLAGVSLGEGGQVDLKPILSDAAIFGVDLYAVGLGSKIEAIFHELSAEAGAVARKLAEF